ncbi:Smr/MutS family protein [Reyranella sp.]|uniref:Smr/MutS family protein n=1 Tax=Reyranella sp. TaxID=1929291 RepID=UPI0037838E5B
MAKDLDLFAAAMVGVKPLASRKRRARSTVKAIPRPKRETPVQRPDKPAAPAAARKPPAVLARLSAETRPLAAELSPDDRVFDRELSRQLARGKLVPQASLDLHHMTLAAAERAVRRFLVEASAQNLRIVLIVTGKGVRLEGGRVLGGRIRAEFIGWLNRADNRDLLRGVRPAHARHGGSGAFYVLLRRRSSASSRSLRATPQR